MSLDTIIELIKFSILCALALVFVGQLSSLIKLAGELIKLLIIKYENRDADGVNFPEGVEEGHIHHDTNRDIVWRYNGQYWEHLGKP